MSFTSDQAWARMWDGTGYAPFIDRRKSILTGAGANGLELVFDEFDPRPVGRITRNPTGRQPVTEDAAGFIEPDQVQLYFMGDCASAEGMPPISQPYRDFLDANPTVVTNFGLPNYRSAPTLFGPSPMAAQRALRFDGTESVCAESGRQIVDAHGQNPGFEWRFRSNTAELVDSATRGDRSAALNLNSVNVFSHSGFSVPVSPDPHDVQLHRDYTVLLLGADAGDEDFVDLVLPTMEGDTRSTITMFVTPDPNSATDTVRMSLRCGEFATGALDAAVWATVSRSSPYVLELATRTGLGGLRGSAPVCHDDQWHLRLWNEDANPAIVRFVAGAHAGSDDYVRSVGIAGNATTNPTTPDDLRKIARMLNTSALQLWSASLGQLVIREFRVMRAGGCNGGGGQMFACNGSGCAICLQPEDQNQNRVNVQKRMFIGNNRWRGYNSFNDRAARTILHEFGHQLPTSVSISDEYHKAGGMRCPAGSDPRDEWNVRCGASIMNGSGMAGTANAIMFCTPWSHETNPSGNFRSVSYPGGTDDGRALKCDGTESAAYTSHSNWDTWDNRTQARVPVNEPTPMNFAEFPFQLFDNFTSGFDLTDMTVRPYQTTGAGLSRIRCRDGGLTDDCTGLELVP